MQEHGLKISELVTLFNLEVLNRGSDYATALLTITDVNRPGLQFHSFYDYFDPRRLQVLGKAEITYLKGLTTEQRRKCFDDLFLYDIPALVISRGLDCFPECLESARVHERTLLRTEETTVEFTSHTIEYLNRVLAPCVTRHGVLLDISGEGVMITGDSGIGKSESAIELIMRGHRLVADDAVEIRRISNQLIGTAPEVIRHYIELRGIGVIDVRQLFGMSASWRNPGSTWWSSSSSGTRRSFMTGWALRITTSTSWAWRSPASPSRCGRAGTWPASWRWRP